MTLMRRRRANPDVKPRKVELAAPDAWDRRDPSPLLAGSARSQMKCERLFRAGPGNIAALTNTRINMSQTSESADLTVNSFGRCSELQQWGRGGGALPCYYFIFL